MGRELASPDWPALTDDEVGTVLRAYPGVASSGAAVVWRSPRPMSAAAVVSAGAMRLFVKRHHVRVRSSAQLAAEHAFADWLRSHGEPVPRVLRTGDGCSVPLLGEYRYEVTSMAAGIDLYRDAVSWSPYLRPAHARAAGAALARLHLAGAGFGWPARPPVALMSSCQVVASSGPAEALERLAASRPGVAGYLAGRPWRDDLVPALLRAAPAVRALPSQWGHGDWHPSNLTWTPDGAVAGVFDFGLANRTFAVHDLAIALERGVVAWLDLPGTGRAAVDFPAAEALLDGYQSVRPLSPAEATALPLVLPVVHVEYALSEIEYFADVTHSPENAGLAYEYLTGHARWFAGPDGRELLALLAPPLPTRPPRPSRFPVRPAPAPAPGGLARHFTKCPAASYGYAYVCTRTKGFRARNIHVRGRCPRT